MSNLIPNNLKDSVEHLRENVMDVFDRWIPKRLKPLNDDHAPLGPSTLFAQGGPAIDVAEDDEAIRVTAELPGLDENDFSVELRDNRLILRGEKKSCCEEKDRNYHFSECSYGTFTRSVPLPCEIDADKVTAHYKHGVLNITLPKTERSQAKKIKIDVS